MDKRVADVMAWLRVREEGTVVCLTPRGFLPSVATVLAVPRTPDPYYWYVYEYPGPDPVMRSTYELAVEIVARDYVLGVSASVAEDG